MPARRYPQPGHAQETNFAAASLDRALEDELRAIVSNARGKVGVYAAEVDGPRAAMLNAEHAFPMASAMKIAVAATYLQGVDEGRFRLDDTYPMRIGTGRMRP